LRFRKTVTYNSQPGSRERSKIIFCGPDFQFYIASSLKTKILKIGYIFGRKEKVSLKDRKITNCCKDEFKDFLSLE
jgi:hypothetical protein